jgi:HPt (histidine-containing phosphotransfer) domain-containing protein
MRKIGHAIKGSAGNLRLEEIANIAKDIEIAGKNKQKVDNEMIVLKSNYEELKSLANK